MENLVQHEKILLFIPMYNCEKQIVRVLNQLTEAVAMYVNEVLVVDNGSQDHGIAAVKDYLQSHQEIKITLVKNHENYNLGGSHKVAIKYAQANGFDFLIVLHGDDQGKITDLLPYLKSGEFRNYDCLLGSRFMKGSHLKNYSKMRIFGNKVFNVIYSISARHKIKDLGSGLNMYRVSIFDNGYYLQCQDSLGFNYEMILKSIYLQHRIKFFPIQWEESDQRSNVKMMKQAMFMLKLAWQNFFNPKKFYHTDHRVHKNFTYDYDVIQKNFKEQTL